MKRDMELVRKLLLYIEENGQNEWLQSDEFAIQDCSSEAIGYHLNIMVEGGLVDVVAQS